MGGVFPVPHHPKDIDMRTVVIERSGANQSISLPADMSYHGVSELEIIHEGDTLTLRPVKPGRESFGTVAGADERFLRDRPDVIHEAGRFDL
jgi:antitoxin VapB